MKTPHLHCISFKLSNERIDNNNSTDVPFDFIMCFSISLFSNFGSDRCNKKQVEKKEKKVGMLWLGEFRRIYQLFFFLGFVIIYIYSVLLVYRCHWSLVVLSVCFNMLWGRRKKQTPKEKPNSYDARYTLLII